MVSDLETCHRQPEDTFATSLAMYRKTALSTQKCLRTRSKEPSASSSDGAARLESCSAMPGTRSLQRIFVDVRNSEGEKRVKAVINTCSLRTLATAELAESLGCAVEEPALQIISIEGQPIDVHGVTDISTSQIDKAVFLPDHTSEVLIIGDLASVHADCVISMDTDSASVVLT